MKYLITRCTLYDMAGCAMIEGFLNGMREADDSVEVAVLIDPKNDCTDEEAPHWDKVLAEKFYHPNHLVNELNEAFDWCDLAIDLGGLFKGYDRYRAEYIQFCKSREKPYVFGPQSFHEPDPRTVEGGSLFFARGISSDKELRRLARVPQVHIMPDFMYLVEPEPVADDVRADYIFTTHKGKPWEPMKQLAQTVPRPVQIILKPADSEGNEYEPLLEIPTFYGSPGQVLSLVGGAKEVHTSRYHVAIAGHYWRKPVQTYVTYRPKYEDAAQLAKSIPLDLMKMMLEAACHRIYKLCNSSKS